MPGSAAIPLGCYAMPGEFNIGTGFLARYKGATALVTAAHTPTRSQPTSEWAQWPTEMLVWLAPGAEITTPLFLYLGTTRIPSFRYNDLVSPRIQDMMLLMGPPYQSMLTRLGSRYPTIDLEEANEAPQKGDELTCFGFPDRHLTQWPYTPPFSSSGPFAEKKGLMFEATMPVETGQSGGPVFDASKKFVGMLIGSTDGVARIVPTASLAQLWP